MSNEHLFLRLFPLVNGLDTFIIVSSVWILSLYVCVCAISCDECFHQSKWPKSNLYTRQHAWKSRIALLSASFRSKLKCTIAPKCASHPTRARSVRDTFTLFHRLVAVINIRRVELIREEESEQDRERERERVRAKKNWRYERCFGERNVASANMCNCIVVYGKLSCLHGAAFPSLSLIEHKN